jgi:hypothetical protein
MYTQAHSGNQSVSHTAAGDGAKLLSNNERWQITTWLQQHVSVIDGFAYMHQQPWKASAGNTIPEQGITDMRSIQQLQAIIKPIKNGIFNVDIEFLPVYHNNYQIDMSRGIGESYLNQFSYFCSNDISVLWTGNYSFPARLDDVEIYRYSKLTNKRMVLLEDPAQADILVDTSTLYNYYPAKILTSGTLIPYYRNDAISENNGAINKVIVTTSALNIIDFVHLQTYADYAWNNAAYHPEFSLYKALRTFYSGNDIKLYFEMNEIIVHLLYENAIMPGKNIQRSKKQFMQWEERYNNLKDKLEVDNTEIVQLFDNKVDSIRSLITRNAIKKNETINTDSTRQ